MRDILYDRESKDMIRSLKNEGVTDKSLELKLMAKTSKRFLPQTSNT